MLLSYRDSVGVQVDSDVENVTVLYFRQKWTDNNLFKFARNCERKKMKSNMLRIFRKKSMQILFVKHLANMTNFPVSPPKQLEIEFGSRSFFVNILPVYTHKRFLHWIYLQMLGRLGWNMLFCENSKCRFKRTKIKPLYNVCKKGFLVYSICMYFTTRMT